MRSSGRQRERQEKKTCLDGTLDRARARTRAFSLFASPSNTSCVALDSGYGSPVIFTLSYHLLNKRAQDRSPFLPTILILGPSSIERKQSNNGQRIRRDAGIFSLKIKRISQHIEARPSHDPYLNIPEEKNFTLRKFKAPNRSNKSRTLRVKGPRPSGHPHYVIFSFKIKIQCFSIFFLFG